MACPEETKTFLCELKNYIPQIIGIFGTLLGTTVGWFLKYLQDNVGKIIFSVNSFTDFKDQSEHYAYASNLFICNHCIKPKYITNIKVQFFNNNKLLFESSPKYANEKNPFMSILTNETINTLNLNFNVPEHICICDLIEKNNLIKLKNANKLVFVYENEKGRKKKIKIKNNFSLDAVATYENGASFPGI